MAIHKIILLCILAFMLHSCKTNKSLADLPSPDRTKSEIVEALMQRNLQYDWYTSKARLKFSSPQESGKGSLYLRIKKDSIIWMTAKKFGVTGVRSVINRDSFTIVYQIDRAFERGALEDLSNALAVRTSFKDMQQLLVGNIILPEDRNLIYDFVKSGRNYTFKANIDNLLISYKVDSYTLDLLHVDIIEGNGRTAQFHYADYKTLDGGQRLPFERKAVFDISPTEKISLDFVFADIELNVPKSTELRISPRFKDISK